MEYQIRTSDKFWADVTDIVNYIADELNNPLAAKKIYYRFMSKIEGLRTMPERGRLANGYHSAKVAKYRIIYRIDKGNLIVNILRVMYSGRNLAKYLG